MKDYGWRLDREDGLSVMRFDLLSDRGIRHGLVVKDGGGDIDEISVYERLSSKSPTVVTEQTHSIKSAVVNGDFGVFYPNRVEVDGLMTSRPGVRLTIHTADCVPVLLAAGKGRSVGLFHCGWRGTADGFMTKAVDKFTTEYRLKPEGLLAVIGPCIEAGCYPVGPEVADRFGRDVKRAGIQDRWLLDLRAENVRQLTAAGLSEENIQVSPLCTRCRADLFHSYRREGAGLKGKMVAFIEAFHEK